MYCTAPLSPRKGRPISFHDDDDDDDYCTDPDVSYGNGRGFPLDVHCWADLRSVHGFRCYDNIAPNAKCQRVLVLALFLVRLVDGTRSRKSARLILFDRNIGIVCDINLATTVVIIIDLFKYWFLCDRIFYVIETTMTSCACLFISFLCYT